MIEEKRTNLVEIVDLLAEFDRRLQRQKLDGGVILLMGESKVGKTTLMYYLQGKPLRHVKNEMDVQVLQPQSLYLQAYIGKDYNSTTICPNFSPEGVPVIDMPGFGDSRLENKLVKLHIFHKIAQRLEQVHFCVVLSEEEFDSNHLLKEFYKIFHFFRPEVLKSQKFISFVISKVEDEDIVSRFDEQIKEMKHENQVNLLSGDELNILLDKNKYGFKNSPPVVNEGLELKQTIVSENTFFDIRKYGDTFLSGSFFKAVSEDQQREQFILEILLLIQDITLSSIELTKLAVSALFYEYSEVIAYLLSEEQEKFINDQKDEILLRIVNIPFKDITPALILSDKEKKEFTSQSLQEINVIFTKKDAKSIDFIFLHQVFNSIQESSLQKINPKFIRRVSQIFTQFSNIISTLMLIQEPEVTSKIDSFFANTDLKKIEDDFYSTWLNNIERLNQSEKYKKWMPQSQGEIRYRIKREPCFQNIKKKSLSDLVKSLSKKQNYSTTETITQKQEALSENQQIMSLENDSSTFSVLIESLKEDEADFENMKKIISKLILILHRFSMFQEALVFAMGIRDEEVVERLLEEGFVSGQISKKFVLEVVFKYFMNFRQDKKNKIYIQLCVNYVMTLAVNPQQLLEFQSECLRQAQNLKQNIEFWSPRQEQHSQILFHFIHPILEERQYYKSMLDKKEKLFKQSLGHRIYQKKAFQDLLR